MARSLRDIPGLGFFERRRLEKEGWGLVHTETVDVIVNQHDTREQGDIYPATMQNVINQHGGRDKVRIIRIQLVATALSADEIAFRVRFYVLGKPRTTVFM